MNAEAVWGDLLRTALLGTERQPGKLSEADGVLGETLVLCKADDREGAVLSAAAAVSLYRRAGTLPEEKSDKNPIAPAPIALEDLPRIGARSSSHLALMLAETHRAVLQEWLVACTRLGKRVPEERLPALLDLGSDQKSFQKEIRGVLGKRGTWLAEQKKTWTWAAYVPEAMDEKALLDAWQTSGKEQRLHLVLQARVSHPVLAMQAVQSTWKEDASDERAAFLEVFATGLSSADEPFLESCLDDRRKEIRQCAQHLLLRLPDSGLRSRSLNRARSVIVLKGLLKKSLEITPPEICDKEMQRDGIEAKGSTAHQMGEKAYLLMQVIAQTPPSHWNGALKQDPANLIKLAAATDWEVALRLGWRQAARLFQDQEWLEALWEAPPIEGKKKAGLVDEGESLNGLTPEHFEKVFTRSFKTIGGLVSPKKDEEGPVQLLRWAPSPWTAGLTRTVLKALKNAAREPFEWRLSPALHSIALEVPADLLGEALAGWPSDGESWDSWRERIDPHLALIQFRFDMLKALEEA